MRFAQARLIHQLGAMDCLIERAAFRRGKSGSVNCCKKAAAPRAW